MASSPTTIPLAAPSGAVKYHDADAEGTVKTVSAGPTVVHAIKINNSANSAKSYVKLFNSAGTVTLGTTVPDEIIEVNGSGSDGGIRTEILIEGKTFDAGLQVAITTSPALATNTNPSSSVILDIAHVPS